MEFFPHPWGSTRLQRVNIRHQQGFSTDGEPNLPSAISPGDISNINCITGQSGDCPFAFMPLDRDHRRIGRRPDGHTSRHALDDVTADTPCSTKLPLPEKSWPKHRPSDSGIDQLECNINKADLSEYPSKSAPSRHPVAESAQENDDRRQDYE